jgi:hypothetical protein
LLQSAAAGALSTLRALDSSAPSGAFVGRARFEKLRGRPHLLDVYAAAKDPATAARLWALHRTGARQAATGLTVGDRARGPPMTSALQIRAESFSWRSSSVVAHAATRADIGARSAGEVPTRDHTAQELGTGLRQRY